MGQEAWTAAFSLDTGFLFTSWQLLYRPGHVVRDYLAGRRACYCAPFKCMLLWIGVSSVVLYLHNQALPAPVVLPPAATTDQFERYGNLFYSLVSENYKVVLAFFTGVLALTARLVFLPARLNLAEHAVTLAYVMSLTALLETVLYVPFLAFSSLQAGNFLSGAAPLLLLPVTAICYGQLLRLKWWQAGLAAIWLWGMGLTVLLGIYSGVLLAGYYCYQLVGVAF
jgi:hypothetical protein